MGKVKKTGVISITVQSFVTYLPMICREGLKIGVRWYFWYLGIDMEFPADREGITEPVFTLYFLLCNVPKSCKSLGIFNKCDKNHSHDI